MRIVEEDFASPLGVTGERCWFNQVAFLSEWALSPPVRDFLVAELGGADFLPFRTADGTGAPVDAETVDLINGAYDRCTVAEPWRRGDVLILDNILTAHGREAFDGSRLLTVAMGGSTALQDG